MTITLTYSLPFDKRTLKMEIDEDSEEFVLNSALKVDLSSLSKCENLRRVQLKRAFDIDLTPLSLCPNLEELTLHDYHRSWLSPPWLEKCANLQIRYLRPKPRSYPWFFLHKAIEQNKKDIRVQQEVLRALELESYGFIDADLTTDLLKIPPDTDLQTARKQVIQLLVREIVSTVQRGGPTVGLELEKLISKHGEIAALIHRIIDRRKQEIDDFEMSTKKLDDLRNLWCTSYGYEILNTLKPTGRQRLIRGFEAGTGLPSTVDPSIYGLYDTKCLIKTIREMKNMEGPQRTAEMCKMSEDLRNAILFIVGNPERDWRDIGKE